MNKDVIYIEPDDDITDIITKIENAKQKIVALVPPKKAGVFRSIVNIKLIAKAGVNAEKAVVLVTTDPSIMKLAAATKLPVTKNLKSAPAVPDASEIEKIEAAATSETVVGEETAESPEAEELKEASEVEELEAEAKPEKAEGPKDEEKPEEADKDVESDKKEETVEDDKKKDKPDEKGSKHKKADKGGPVGGATAWIQKHKVLTICAGVGLVILVLVIIWAKVIAPAVKVNVEIRTTTANFSENVTFVDKLADENASEGKFYVEEKKIESKAEVEFEATGKKNVGKKAGGILVVHTYFPVDGGAVAVNAGVAFTHGELTYYADESTTLSYDGSDATKCENASDANSLLRYGCQISAEISVTAAESGSGYNLAASNSGWHSNLATISVSYAYAMEGGTDETITVVQQSDIDLAKEQIKASSEEENKKKLFETLGEDDFKIESSFRQTVGEATSTPALGEKVEEGKKAKLSVTTTDSVYIIDKTKVEEYIKEKAKLAEGYKIYEMKDPFIENFTKTETGYIGKLKTSYVSGPEVTAKDVVEVVRGKGLGTGRDDLMKEYSGISSVTTEVSFPWVTAFPNDEEKITVNIEVKGTSDDKKEEKDEKEE